MKRICRNGSLSRRCLALLGAAVIVWGVAGRDASAAGTSAAAPSKPASSCVACHTDVEKIKAEAANIPVPAGSALQSGKG